MRATTKERYMTVLRYMHEQTKPFSLLEIKQKAGAHSTMLSSCVRLGLIERKKGKYSWVGDVPTKTTANRVHANLRKTYEKPVERKVVQPIKRSPRRRVRTASILWGLIKFNY
jgi:hypothetical protein